MKPEVKRDGLGMRLVAWAMISACTTAVLAALLSTRSTTVKVNLADPVMSYLPGLPHYDAMGTFRTANLVVESYAQVGPQAPNANERVFIKSTSTADTVTEWIQNVSTEHVGTGGNNESIPLGLRVNVGFAMGVGGTAVGRAIDIDSACSKSSGTGTLDCEGILIGAAGGDTNNAIHVLTGGVLIASTQGLAVTAGPSQVLTLTATDTINANKASGTALSVPNAAFSMLQNGTIGTNSTNTLALNSSVTTDVIMTTTSADQIFRMTNNAAGGHNYGLDNGGTAGFFAATLTMYDNTASRIAWQVSDATGSFTVPNAFIGSSTGSFGGALDMTSHLINNVTDPVSAQDAATKNYVDTHSGTGSVVVDQVYGDGQDGSQTWDGSTTILGIVPSGGIYTLTRDVFLTSSTVNNGVIIIGNGWRVFATGTLTLTGNANINNSGGNGGQSTAGTGGGGAGTRMYAVGAAGGTGGNGAASGAQGADSGQGLNRYFNTHASTAVGADGAATGMGGGGGDGGVLEKSGAITVNAAQAGGPIMTDLLYGRALANASNQWSTGSGGGGGACNGSTGKGGGGGGAGGVVFVAARTLAGTGTISSTGGNGGNALAGNSSHAGGGGGGGGGLVIVVYNTNSGVTFSVAGGSKGNPTGTGTTAGNGFAGAIIKYNLSGDGT